MAIFDVTSKSLADPIINGFNHIAPKIPAAVVALCFGLLVIRLVSWLAAFLIGLIHMPRGLKGIIVSLIDALLWVFLIISILQSLGLNNLALIFSGSIAAIGLAIGVGGASLASDILAGVFLARDRDFRIGDKVIAGEGPTEGIVESMDMRRTRIRDQNDKLHVVPNSVVERKEWVLLAKKRDLDDEAK